jgi:hypothetical protein
MEHVVHLGTGAFIRALAPTPKAAVLKNQTSSKDALADDPDENDENLSDEDSDDYTAGDAVGKILALVNQVCIHDSLDGSFELKLWFRSESHPRLGLFSKNVASKPAPNPWN